MPDIRVEDYIRETARKHGVPPALALAIAEQESSFNPKALGPEITEGRAKGQRAIGTFQIIPSTGEMLGIDPTDPVQNIEGGVKYLRQLLDQNQGDLDKVLASYGGVVDDTTYIPQVKARVMRWQRSEREAQAGSAAAVGSQTTTGAPTAGRGALAGPAGQPAPGAPVGGRGGPPTGPAAGGLPGGGAGAAPDISRAMAMLGAPFDPRTPEGRANLLATGASLAATYATGGGSVIATTGGRMALPWITRVLSGPLGALAGGMVSEAGEQVVGTPGHAPSPTAVGAQGLLQAGYELAGQAIMWPIVRLGKRFGFARRVGRPAREAIETSFEQSKEAARSLNQAQAALRKSKVHTAEALADQDLTQIEELAAITRQYDNILEAPPAIREAGAQVTAVLEGPTQRAFDLAKRRVAQAAEGGPPLAVGPIKDALDAVAQKLRPSSIFGEVDAATRDAIGFLSKQGSRARQAIAAQVGAPPDAPVEAIAKALGVSADNPLPGILGKVQQISVDELPFADAHRLKVWLDDAIEWTAVHENQRLGQVAQITKRLRTQLREMLAVYEPYNIATQAAGTVFELHRKGAGRQLIKTISSGRPDRVAELLKPDAPSDALALRELLVDQAAVGGDAAAGQQAWDTVRSAFTYDHLIRGGIDGLQDRVARLLVERPEFAKIVYNDEAAQAILSNLDRLGAAYKIATRGSSIARTQDIKAARAAMTELRGSTLWPYLQRMDEFVVPDLLRFIGLPKTSVWALLSAVRLLAAPAGEDLLQYAAYSPQRTQQLLGILLGSAPPTAAVATMRELLSIAGASDLVTPPPTEETPPNAGPPGAVEPVPAIAR